MKLLLSAILASVIFISCGSQGSKEHEGHDMNHAESTDSASHSSADASDVKTVSVAFSSIDAKLSSSLKLIVDHYLHTKNALANDNSQDAMSGAKAMSQAIGSVDKSLFTAEQKKVYDGLESALKTNADQIAIATDIKVQRNHFVELSEAVYNLAKNFGAGRTVYHDHCPMARDNQGAMWISESKEVKNPYFGADMPTCGTVEEKID